MPDPVAPPEAPTAPPRSAVLDAVDKLPASAFEDLKPNEKPAPPSTPRVPTAPQPPPAPAPTAPPPAPPKPAAPPPATPSKPTVPPLKSKPAAPPADVPPVEDALPEEIKSTKAADHWNRVVADKKKLSEQLKAKENEINQLKSSKTPEEIETLRKQNAELSERIRLLNVEQHPQFQKHFGERTQAALARAKSVVGADHAEKAARILQMPDGDYRNEQLEALFQELPATKQPRLMAALMELDTIATEKAAAIARAKEDRTAYEGQEQQQVQARQKQVQQTLESVVREAMDPEQGIEVFKLRDGDDEWNQGVKESIELAKHIFSGQLPWDELARASLWAASAPRLLASEAALAEENAALKAENEKLRASTPSPSGGGDAPADKKTHKSILDAVSELSPNAFQQ